MTAEDAFLTLKKFIETNAASKASLKHLRAKNEIGIVIGDAVSCALFQTNGQPILEHRAAVSPDVVFEIAPQSIYTLVANATDSVGEMGVLVLKECLAGQVHIKIPGSILHLMTRGYLQILAAGGSTVMGFLARYGLGNVQGVIKKIKSMKDAGR